MDHLARNCAFLVGLHEPAVADHIGRKDRGEPANDILASHAACQKTQMVTSSLMPERERVHQPLQRPTDGHWPKFYGVDGPLEWPQMAELVAELS